MEEYELWKKQVQEDNNGHLTSKAKIPEVNVDN
jgi:hypothetical protein